MEYGDDEITELDRMMVQGQGMQQGPERDKMQDFVSQVKAHVEEVMADTADRSGGLLVSLLPAQLRKPLPKSCLRRICNSHQ